MCKLVIWLKTNGQAAPASTTEPQDTIRCSNVRNESKLSDFKLLLNNILCKFGNFTTPITKISKFLLDGFLKSIRMIVISKYSESP